MSKSLLGFRFGECKSCRVFYAPWFALFAAVVMAVPVLKSVLMFVPSVVTPADTRPRGRPATIVYASGVISLRQFREANVFQFFVLMADANVPKAKAMPPVPPRHDAAILAITTAILAGASAIATEAAMWSRRGSNAIVWRMSPPSSARSPLPMAAIRAPWQKRPTDSCYRHDRCCHLK
jgi:hypothetical protein